MLTASLSVWGREEAAAAPAAVGGESDVTHVEERVGESLIITGWVFFANGLPGVQSDPRT